MANSLSYIVFIIDWKVEARVRERVQDDRTASVSTPTTIWLQSAEERNSVSKIQKLWGQSYKGNLVFVKT